MPPFETLFDGTSDTSPPRQRQLASIAHHRAWLDTMAMWRALDPQAEVETGRRLRESTRMTSVSQPFAAAWLRMLPSEVSSVSPNRSASSQSGASSRAAMLSACSSCTILPPHPASRGWHCA